MCWIRGSSSASRLRPGHTPLRLNDSQNIGEGLDHEMSLQTLYEYQHVRAVSWANRVGASQNDSLMMMNWAWADGMRLSVRLTGTQLLRLVSPSNSRSMAGILSRSAPMTGTPRPHKKRQLLSLCIEIILRPP